MRNAVAEACFSVVPAKPRYSPMKPCSRKMRLMAWGVEPKRFALRASSIRAVLMRSVGVTAKIDARIPEAIPARRLRSGVSELVSGSAKAFLMVSKVRKRTPSLAMEP